MQDTRLTDLLIALQQALNFSECWSIYRKTVGDLGFDLGNFVTVLPGSNTVNDLVYLADYPDEYLTGYDELNGFENDIAVQLSNTYKKSFDMTDSRWYRESLFTPEQKAIEHLGFDFGIKNGCSIPFVDGCGQVYGGVGLYAQNISDQFYHQHIRRELPFIEQATRLFQSFADQHFRYDDVVSKKPFGIPALTQDEIEIIKWLLEGKKLQFIADHVLYKSLSRVNQHVRSAKKKLRACSLEQMVYRAVILGFVG